MRRILRKIAAGEEDSIGDTSTLADPSVSSQLLSLSLSLSISSSPKIDLIPNDPAIISASLSVSLTPHNATLSTTFVLLSQVVQRLVENFKELNYKK